MWGVVEGAEVVETTQRLWEGAETEGTAWELEVGEIETVRGGCVSAATPM